MKYAVFFVLCLVAMAAAAPQIITTYPGLTAPFTPFAPRTLVAGPTVYNGWNGIYGNRLLAPGYWHGPTFI